jgi:hypothetical protein
MNYNAFVDLKTRRINRTAIAAGSDGVVGGARWFWWIAILSLLHLILTRYQLLQGAPLCLSFTASVDRAFVAHQPTGHFFIAGVFLFFLLVGWAASRGVLWAFVLGIAVYIFDALLSLHDPSRLAFIFHLAALYFLVRGAYTLHNAITTAEMAAMEQSYEREPHGPADDGENAPG